MAMHNPPHPGEFISVESHYPTAGVNPMARPSKFAHVVYMTRRFDEMIRWYQMVFDATVAYQDPASAFLTYDEEHQSQRMMLTDTFVANPIGVEIDPEDLLAQYRSGVPVEKLLAQLRGPMSAIPPQHGLM